MTREHRDRESEKDGREEESKSMMREKTKRDEESERGRLGSPFPRRSGGWGGSN